ncbi:hypothetical protein Hanom_Chr01g00056101 [Helianthus anomalus]
MNVNFNHDLTKDIKLYAGLVCYNYKNTYYFNVIVLKCHFRNGNFFLRGPFMIMIMILHPNTRRHDKN